MSASGVPRLHWVLVAVAMLALAVVVGACGSDDDSAAADKADTASKPSGPAPKGQPVKVMLITPYDNPLLDWGQAITGAEAAADAINADGGIGGRPLKIVPCNERVDPNKAARCARDAGDGTYTAVITDSLFPQQIFPLLDKAKVPNVGGFVTEPDDTQARMAYPVFPGVNLINGAWPGVLADQGKSKIAAVVEGRASTVTDVEVLKEGSEHAGIEFAGAVGVPVETTEYSPKVQELRDLDADAVVSVLSRPLLTGALTSAGELGFDTPFATFSWTVFDSMLKEVGPGAEGMLTLDMIPPATASDEFAAIKQFNEEMDAAGADGTDDRSTQAVLAWLATHTIDIVGDRVEGKLDNKSFVAELDSGKSVDVLGLVDWVPGEAGPGDYKRLSNGNLYLSEVKDGQLQLVQKEPFDGFALAGLE